MTIPLCQTKWAQNAHFIVVYCGSYPRQPRGGLQPKMGFWYPGTSLLANIFLRLAVGVVNIPIAGISRVGERGGIIIRGVNGQSTLATVITIVKVIGLAASIGG
jgi:hypothetical protein